MRDRFPFPIRRQREKGNGPATVGTGEAVPGHLTHQPIDVAAWHRRAADPQDGASVEFLGIVRRQEEGRTIASLDYEAYEPMAERMIARLIAQAKRRWPLHQVHVRHRLGCVAVGQVAVLIGVEAPHRDEAFEACRFLIDALKRDVPIWKAAVDAPRAGRHG